MRNVKDTPEYIGATNRAARRRARLAELDARLAGLAGQRVASQAELDTVVRKIKDIDLAGRELPATTDVAEAATALTTASALRRDAEAELAEAEKYTADAGALASPEVEAEVQKSVLAEAEAALGRDYQEAIEAMGR